jgi:hypothetical protein
MKGGKLHHIEIHPGEHGHKVVHHMEHSMSRNHNAPSGFSTMGNTEEHYFGDGEEHKMLAHVAKILDIRLPSSYKLPKTGKEGSTEMDTEGSRHEVGEEMD